MNKIESTFKRLKERGEGALVSYMMVGYPSLEDSLKAFEILIESGSDILEVGFPFSDPVADGPTIQVAHEIALKNGVGLKDVLTATKELRSLSSDIPILIMTYYNPMFKVGIERFCSYFKEAGCDGFIVPDLPPEESEELKRVCRKLDLALVMLASPTSSRERLKLICETTDCFTYMVSVTGTTGARKTLPLEDIKEKVRIYRDVCSKPVVVGFGVSSKDQAREICSFADGVVVGSLFVKLSGERQFNKLESVCKEIKEGTKTGRSA